MSHEATAYILRLLRSGGAGDAADGLNPTDRLILLLLADRHNPDSGQCWPSVSTVAREAGVAVRAVQRSIRKAERAGILTRTDRHGRGGQQTTNGYRFPALDGPAGASPVPPRGVTHDTGGVSSVTPGGVSSVTPRTGKREPVTEKNDMKATGDGCVAGCTSARGGTRKDPVAAAYHEHFGPWPTPAQYRQLAAWADRAAEQGKPALVADTIAACALRGRSWDRLRDSVIAALEGRAPPGGQISAPRGRAVPNGPAPIVPGPDWDAYARKWNEDERKRRDAAAARYAAGIERDPYEGWDPVTRTWRRGDADAANRLRRGDAGRDAAVSSLVGIAP